VAPIVIEHKEMTETGYLTLELEEDESIELDLSILKYIRALESEYNSGETVIAEDEDFRLEWPLWNLIKQILTEFNRTYGTSVGPNTYTGLRKSALLDDIQLYDLYRMLRVMYHYESSLMIHLLLGQIISRLLPLDPERLVLMNPKLGRKPAKGLRDTLTQSYARINETYSVFRELLMTAFTLYLGVYDLLDIIEKNYLPQVTSILASGDAHVALLTSTGLLVKGNNTYGQLGLGMPDTPPDQWYTTAADSSVISVWCGAEHTLILTSNKGLLGFGSNEYGQLGLENRRLGKRVFEPAQIKLPQVLSVACGTQHSMALTVEGVFAFGRNNYGQLGIGEEGGMIAYIPVLIDVEEAMSAVACGDHYSMLLSETGNVYHTGRSMDGIPVNTRRPIKLQLPEDAQGKITKIVCGERHAILINSTNEVFVLGSNHDGQLGLGNKQPWKAITKHPTLKGIVNAEACVSWSMFIDEQGDLYTCGSNNYNQLGVSGGIIASSSVPVKVDIRNVIAVACGLTYSKILTCDGLFTTRPGTDSAPLEKEHRVRVSERPICKKPLFLRDTIPALHCHLCGSQSNDLFIHSKTERILCSKECHLQYKHFRVPFTK
jgi:alpha-tubulin suppressor-like RCC1 family protein